MCNAATCPQSIDTRPLFGRLKYALATWWHNLTQGNKNVHLVGRDHNHIHDQYNRKVTFADGLLTTLGNLLLKDPLFLKAVGGHHGDRFMVRAVINGDDVRANIYPLERFNVGQLQKPYHENWRRDGIMNYVITVSMVNDTAYFTVDGVDAPYNTDLSYDIYEPQASYVRTLNDDELAQVNPITRLNCAG